MRAELVARVTRVLSELDDDPTPLYREPRAWVHIVEIPDGNMGAFGRVMPTADIVAMTVGGETEANEHARKSGPTQETGVDPICGMTVALTDEAITLERGGTTYAFCSTVCRDLFAEQHDAGARA
jgi:YHS domain-containing protein